MTLAITLGVLVATTSATGAAVAALLPLLRRRLILDHPAVRSSHTAPTPRGGGVAVVGVTLAAWGAIGLLGNGLPTRFPLLLLGAGLLMVVSALDDLRDLSPVVRLGCQVLAVGLGVAVLGSGELVFQGVLPLWFDRTLTIFGWIWLVNLWNFMDGIDGLTMVGSASVSLGVGAVLLLGHAPAAGVYVAAAVVGAALGFLPWNWYPAKAFLGDVGSIPLGYLLGWLLIDLAVRGFWAAALILPLYYLADATLTLVRRVARGAPPWAAHREHFYQRATPLGESHAPTVLKVLAVDLLLVLLAVASRWAEAAAILGAFVAVGALLAVLGSRRRPRRRHHAL